MTTFTTEDRLNAYSHYKIYDENGELMRTVKTKHEAVHLTQTYTDWTYQFVKADKPKFEDAPF
jgi:hypothetical protein